MGKVKQFYIIGPQDERAVRSINYNKTACDMNPIDSSVYLLLACNYQ